MSTFWDRVKGLVDAVLGEVVDVPTPPPSRPPPTDPIPVGDPRYIWFGTQRGPTVKAWNARWEANARRQAAEAQAERDAVLRAGEALRRDLEQQPNRAYLPPPSPPQSGLSGLFDFIQDMQQRRD